VTSSTTSRHEDLEASAMAQGAGADHFGAPRPPPAVSVRRAMMRPARPTAPDVDALWTAEDVSAYLRVSLSMAYMLRRQGALPFVRVGTLYLYLYRFDRQAGAAPPPAVGRGHGQHRSAPRRPLPRR
jgi:excisionase family DNA binding protein